MTWNDRLTAGNSAGRQTLGSTAKEKAVVAVFDGRHDAQAAREALTAAGFIDSRVRVTSTGNHGIDSRTSVPRPEEQSLGDRIADFFGFGEHDETYTEAVRRGGHVVTVDADDDEEADRAELILDRFGPVDIDQRAAQWRDNGWQSTRSGLAAQTERTASFESGEEAVIPVAEERLAVGKRAVQRGGVRVISRTVEQPVEASVSLREEHATITRHPVDRAVTDGDAAFQDLTVEVRETGEEAVIGKTARVVEEVRVGKETGSREETVRDTVRKTEVDVEQLGTRRDSGGGGR